MGQVNGSQTRIDTMFAFVAVDEDDNTEGICSVWMGPENGHMPLMGADMERVEALRPAAEMIQRESGLEIRLVHFQTRVDVETLIDGKWEQ